MSNSMLLFVWVLFDSGQWQEAVTALRAHVGLTSIYEPDNLTILFLIKACRVERAKDIQEPRHMLQQMQV